MKVIHARNVHQALPLALDALRAEGVRRDSRNGPVIKFPTPVTTVYQKPEERVMFWDARDANPFFHFIESLWMLDGRNDVESVARYVNRMRTFSDDGRTFHGAYGYRWRHQFGIDQLPKIIEALRKNPDDRRQVLSMWDAPADLGRDGKDLPCNLQVLFQVNDSGDLDMIVTNRSNDMIWGAYGANAVHFSVLHEFVARGVGVGVGRYFQVSANFHAYINVLEPLQDLADQVPDPMGPSYAPEHWSVRDPYAAGQVRPMPIMAGTDYVEWLNELSMFMGAPHAIGYRDPFFRRVASPIVRAFDAYKENGAKNPGPALAILQSCAATDWKLECEHWLQRREESARRRERAKDDGPAYD